MPGHMNPDEARVDRLKKLFESAGPYSKVLGVVERIFQRAPELVQELEEQVEEEGGSLVSRKRRLVELIVEKIVELCDDVGLAHDLGVPSKLSKYVAYTELVLLRVKSESNSQRQWSVNKLLDFPTRADDSVQIEEEAWALRTKLKGEMKKLGFEADVQTEADSSRIWVRVTSTKTSKDKYKDRKKLEKARATFLVHYPGEPYIYSSANLSESLKASLITSFDCDDSRKLELSGKCVASLRTLRLGRDARDLEAGQGVSQASQVVQEVSQASQVPGRFSVLQHQTEAELGMVHHPRLESVTLSVSNEVEGIQLSCNVSIVGTDVIGGLNDLVKTGIIASPAPQWVKNLPTAGRNKFTLKAQSKVNRDDDMESVLSKAWE